MATRRTARQAEPRPETVTVRVVRRFTDLAEGQNREAGDEFEATVARFKEIDGKLPGYVELA